MAKVLIIVVFSVLLTPLCVEAKMYRWVDADGKVQYSDQVPPSAASLGRTEFNATGTPVTKVAPAKSAETIQLEAKQAKEVAELAQIAAEKKRKDQELLDSYADVLELVTAYENRLTMQKSNLRQMRLARTKIASQVDDLGRDLEKATTKDDQKRIAGFIRTAEESLRTYDKAIEQGLSETVDIQRQYDADKIRLQQLLDEDAAKKAKKSSRNGDFKLILEPV